MKQKLNTRIVDHKIKLGELYYLTMPSRANFISVLFFNLSFKEKRASIIYSVEARQIFAPYKQYVILPLDIWRTDDRKSKEGNSIVYKISPKSGFPSSTITRDFLRFLIPKTNNIILMELGYPLNGWAKRRFLTKVQDD